jgi:hypothetical protein
MGSDDWKISTFEPLSDRLQIDVISGLGIIPLLFICTDGMSS